MDRTTEKQIYYGKEGGSVEPGVTLGEVFSTVAKTKGDKVALRVQRDADGFGVLGTNTGTWRTWTWAEYYAETRAAAKSFMALGLERFESVNIIGFNSPEWFMADMGCVLAGGIAAGIYTTNAPQAVKYIAEHSGGRIAVVEDQKQLDKFLAIKEELPKLEAIVVWGRYDASAAESAAVPVHSWKAFLDLGKEVSDADLDARMNAQKPGHCSHFIYTSGTTGNPKAVMVSHDGISFEASTVMKMITAETDIGSEREDRVLSYLPLSHVAGLMVDMVCPLMISYTYPGWIMVEFAQPDALKGTLPNALKHCRPTMFLGVPRVWEKVSEAMKAKVRANPPTGLKLKIARWAKAKGKVNAYNKQLGGNGQTPMFFGLASKLVFSKVRDALGLDACEFAFTGAAPITVETLEYFGQLGIQINEVYGMSECTGATTWSTDRWYKWGSCGFEMSGTQVKVDHSAERGDREGEGELCYRGRHIMLGYMANPDLGDEHMALIERKNREAIDEDGWLHSGDIGRMDENGMFYITGRIKELIIGAGGENIAPVPIEDAIKSNCPALSNVMMIGDKRKYNTMLVTLKCDMNMETGEPLDTLAGQAKDVNPAVTKVSEAMNDPVWQKYITEGITKYNNGDMCVSRAQKVQKFRILPADFTEKGGELTATLKLKRASASSKYADVIEEMYAEAKPSKADESRAAK